MKIEELINYYEHRMKNAERNSENAKTKEQKAFYAGCVNELEFIVENLKRVN